MVAFENTRRIFTQKTTGSARSLPHNERCKPLQLDPVLIGCAKNPFDAIGYSIVSFNVVVSVGIGLNLTTAVRDDISAVLQGKNRME